jgi:catechol 2,3-dioxygenase-like lactoylglutathione lyase family enzyme
MIHGMHSAISVKDMEASLAFYRDLLGMSILMDLDVSDDRIGRVLGEPGTKCRIVHLGSGNAVIELFQYEKPVGQNIAANMKQYDHGLTHIGLEVTGFQALAEKLEASNVEFLGEKVEFRPGVWVAYFRGPDGEVCEIREQMKEQN